MVNISGRIRQFVGNHHVATYTYAAVDTVEIKQQHTIVFPYGSLD